VATVLREHGIRRFDTADTDFRKFDFLEVVNPQRAKR
jgi:predicted nucleic acid-binding protein